MQRRGTSILALILAFGALPAPALALRRAAHVHPHAFASCARLVHYERTHFAITHGVPEASPRPLTEPSLAAPSPSVRAPQVAPAVENAGTTAGGTYFSPDNEHETGTEERHVLQ